MYALKPKALDHLLKVLASDGYEILGPTVQRGTIMYGEIASLDDLPIGWTDRQEAGTYRLERRKDEAMFGYVVGPQSWKQFLNPPRALLWRSNGNRAEFEIETPNAPIPKRVFFGVRPCEVQAIALQDQVYLQGPHQDAHYKTARENTLIIAVNCTEPGGTCFCASMATGPKAPCGYDIVLTELLDNEGHRFLAEAGSEEGKRLLKVVRAKVAEEAEVKQAERLLKKAASKMGRSLNPQVAREVLARQRKSSYWDEVGARCMGCANCTMACPTCFCSTVEDVTDLSGAHAERWRLWDSCFTMDFSYIHGGSTRKTSGARYRQWLSHKFSTWYEQFGAGGCVGCGRCITWCPVGIDVTEEIHRFVEDEKPSVTA